jgi:ABC-type dipeptide/oligopeptide/nickel transport system permease component
MGAFSRIFCSFGGLVSDFSRSAFFSGCACRGMAWLDAQQFRMAGGRQVVTKKGQWLSFYRNMYFLRRIFYGVGVMVLVVCIISGIIFLAPVDPAQLTFGQRSDLSTVKAKTAQLGLDQPLHKQLAAYLRDLSPVDVLELHKDNQRKYSYFPLLKTSEATTLVLKWPYLRESFQTGRPVAEILGDAIPSTALLAAASMLLAVFFGVVFGVVAALRPRSWVDYGISVISVFGYSLPSYVSAMLFALVFGYAFSAWTGLDIQGSLRVIDDFGEWQWRWQNLILPALALGLRPVALITQLTRSAMLDVLSQDYIRTARAKGLPDRVVWFKHALRNTLNPLISAISGWFAALLTGAFFVEAVFNFKGLGDVTVQALLNFDIPVVLGSVLFTSAIFIAINVLSDVLYALADPRVRME